LKLYLVLSCLNLTQISTLALHGCVGFALKSTIRTPNISLVHYYAYPIPK
jgi:hypothetical protein